MAGLIDLETFGQYLRYWRDHAGVSQKALAEACQVSTSYMCDIEQNRRATRSMKLLEPIAATLGRPLDEVCGMAGVLPPDLQADIFNVIAFYRAFQSGRLVDKAGVARPDMKG